LSIAKGQKRLNLLLQPGIIYLKNKISGIAFQGNFGPNIRDIRHTHGIIKEILKYKSKN
jgi:hypothetical protein